MKKLMKLLCILLAIIFFTPVGPSFAQVKSQSRTQVDSIQITKITPRTLSHLLRPVNMPIHLEVEYNLQSEPSGVVAIRVLKITRSNPRQQEIKDLGRIYKVKKGKNTLRHITPPLAISIQDDTVLVYTIASLIGARGKELAYSSSKNEIAGSYKVFLGKDAPVRDYISRISIQPSVGSDIQVGKVTTFVLTLKFSVKSKPLAYIDMLVCDIAEMGTLRAIKVATIVVPRGQGTLKMEPSFNFEKNLSGRNIGLEVILWLNPLKTGEDSLKITEFFLK